MTTSLPIPRISSLDLRSSGCVSASPVKSGVPAGVPHVGGGFSGTMMAWLPSKLNRQSESVDRKTVVRRSKDLVANDPHAASIIGGMTTNSIGTGLIPLSRPNMSVLGWTEKQAEAFSESAEWCFSIWAKEADAGGRLPWWAIQSLCIRSLLTSGEFIRLPVMINDSSRTFSLALQSVDSERLYTPADLNYDPKIRDGVEINRYGGASAFWIANPKDIFSTGPLTSGDFKKIPARAGHRPNVFHSFWALDEESVRGYPVLAAALKFFKDLNDYLDFELVGAIVAASFPVFIETSNPHAQAFADGTSRFQQASGTSSDATGTPAYREINPGQVVYGQHNQKPHILKSDRPGNTFPAFVERMLRAVGAPAGMPYEVTARDYSKTNYSSARAAMLDAWRVLAVYQKWLVDSFCQPVWDMVLEEAWLRGMLDVPGNADWYQVKQAASAAVWIPPRRGNVDPLKEAKAETERLGNFTTTLADEAAAQGGDWRDMLRQREKEMQYLARIQEITRALEDDNADVE